MARQPRLDLPGVAQHIVQRGNDRQPCFAHTADYLRYRQEFGEAAIKHGCAVHCYVLMTNHVHLLVTPAEPGGASRLMQATGRRYVASFNARHRRTGTLWGRFKSALVDTEHYALACYRYIELNPVRAGMVADPLHYRWSSIHHNADGATEPRLQAHPAYLQLGASDEARRAAYRQLIESGLSTDDREGLALHTRQQKPWGSDRFKRQIEALLQRSVQVRPRGRPKTSKK